ncbi:MAG: hypothetical protein EPO11_10425, partial [Gammaproteobacteria bacterium]
MKKKRLLLAAALFSLQTTASYAADLLEVYQQALISDPTYQQAIAQRLSTKEGVPISIASILPNVAITANPAITRSAFSGSDLQTDVNGNPLSPRNNTVRTYTLALTATQTVF